jgi:polyvinyl alcohol dehydrogenase (cytochrome)
MDYNQKKSSGESSVTAKAWFGLGAVVAAALSLAAPAQAQSDMAAQLAAATAAPVDAEAIFDKRCKSCHEPPVEHAPSRASLAGYPPAYIEGILTRGVMAPMAAGLSPAEIKAVAALIGAHAGAQAATTDVICKANPPIRATRSSWSSWGADPENSHFQRQPGLLVKDIPRLKVKWAFSYAGGAYGQPTVVGDWLFITSRGGRFYALDARTGCVHWRADGIGSRTTPMVEHRADLSPSGWVTYVGDGQKIVHAFDAQTGKELWKSAPLETHMASVLTGSPILYKNQLFVPTSSGEEVVGRQPGYPCCSFRGAVVALDARTGKVEWKTTAIGEPMRVLRKTAQGNNITGPAGAAIWSAPTVDAKRKVVYVATGDSYTEAETTGDDAIIAIDMATGRVKWRTQVTAKDNFLVGCGRAGQPANCPDPTGPDYDFGASPILHTLPNGHQVVLSGQKSGIAYGMDPDTGKLLWKTRVGGGGAIGGVEWGIAADGKRVYVPVSDIGLMFQILMGPKPAPGAPPMEQPQPGLTALDPASGKVIWHTPAPVAPCKISSGRRGPGCFNAQSAADSVMPGAVFSGAMDGWLRAYSSSSGKIIWAFSTTAQTYDTVNGVKGQPGGSIDAMGPVIAGGMVYTMSGYNGAVGIGGNGTNVLLAFSVDGK